MNAVLINSLGIIIGSIIGISFKRFLNEKILSHVEEALGFCVVILGLKMSLQYDNIFVMLLSLGIGAALGHYWNVDAQMNKVADFIKNKFSKSDNAKFSAGLSTSSILFCTGSMAIIGSINAALGNSEILNAKAFIDGVLSIIFASIYGVSVGISAIPVFLYQGSIALGASKLDFLLKEEILNDLTCVGGILLLMIGLSLAKLKNIKTANFLPAIALAFIFTLINNLWIN